VTAGGINTIAHWSEESDLPAAGARRVVDTQARG